MTRERMSREHRHITRRIIVKGTLTLTTPACLSNGDTDSPVDIALLQDSISNHALLTGTSLAGALRNYLREYEYGYDVKEGSPGSEKSSLAVALFGGMRQDDDGEQSPLIVHDAISNAPPEVELRDGVRIDGATGTVWINRNEEGEIIGGAKYDLALLAAGTEFPLYFELLIDQTADEQKLKEALVIALRGLEQQGIGLGMKKRRGFGRCQVKTWDVWQFDLKEGADRLAWLTFDRDWAVAYASQPRQGSMVQALSITPTQVDSRQFFKMAARMKLDSSLLIRSGQADGESAPDVVHLKSQRNSKLKPILSGTSLAGVLRHRATRIINTIRQSTNSDGLSLVDELFGFVEESKAASSRLIVHESVIEGGVDLIQNRIAIDRFTGGAYHGALIDERPIWGVDETSVTLELVLRSPSKSEVGLLLLLLKDLWTGDLPVGGEASIGRGRLRGDRATLTHRRDGRLIEWKLANDGQLEQGNAKDLQNFVDALWKDILADKKESLAVKEAA